MKPILFDGCMRWYEPTSDGGGWIIRCVSVDKLPPMYASEAAAFADLSASQAASTVDWSKDL